MGPQYCNHPADRAGRAEGRGNPGPRLSHGRVSGNKKARVFLLYGLAVFQIPSSEQVFLLQLYIKHSLGLQVIWMFFHVPCPSFSFIILSSCSLADIFTSSLIMSLTACFGFISKSCLLSMRHDVSPPFSNYITAKPPVKIIRPPLYFFPDPGRSFLRISPPHLGHLISLQCFEVFFV